jgi:hypothetical protein
MALILIYTLVIIVIISVFVLWDCHRIAAFLVAMLGLYVVPSQIAYSFFPWLAEGNNFYFGPDIVGETLVFCIGSIGLLTILVRFYTPADSRELYPPLLISRFRFNMLGFIYSSIILIGGLYFRGDLNYATVSDHENVRSRGVLFVIYLSINKLTTGLLVVAYSIYRQNQKSFTQSLSAHLSIALMFLSYISIAAMRGARSDFSTIFLGIIAWETLKMRISQNLFRRMLRITLFTAGLLIFATVLAEKRLAENKSVTANTLVETILLQDYFAPAHTLVGAIKYKYVDPNEVIRSNTANLLFGLDYPFLQQSLCEVVFPEFHITRSQSFAFYTLTEGYMVAGFNFGTIYNAIVLSTIVGIFVWVLKFRKNLFRCYLIPVICSQMVILVRCQSCTYLKQTGLVLFGVVIYLIAIKKNYVNQMPSARRVG